MRGRLGRPGALEQNVTDALTGFLGRLAAIFDESRGAGRILAGIWAQLLLAVGALILFAWLLGRLVS